MAYDKVVDSAKLDSAMVATADAIRSKAGSTESIVWDDSTGFADAVNALPEAGGFEEGKKAEYDRFWDAFQQNGNRTDYYYLFAGYGWTVETFTPKYDLRGTRFQQTFYAWAQFRGSLIDSLNKCGVVLDTSKATSISGMFQNAGYITEIPHIDMSSVTTGVGGLFSSCKGLVRIEKVTYTENPNCYNDNVYSLCSSLTDLTVDGVIAGNMDLQWSTKLNKASITSIINTLSSTTSGLSVTLSKTAVENAFTTDEWNALANTKTNWTFNLL